MANTKIPAELSSTPGIIDNSNATAITIDSSENVGIGATSANSSRLRLDNGGTSGAPQLMLTATGASTQTEIRHDTSNNLIFENWNSGRTERMRIDSSGRVGIGTSSPSMELDVRNDGSGGVAEIGVRGGTSGAGVVQISGNGTTYGSTSFDLIQNSSAAYVFQRANLPLILGTNATERMRIDTSGTMILQADGAANLGRIQFSNQASTYQILGGNYIGYMGYKTGGYHRWFGSDTAEKMRLDSSGNLLVGTTSANVYNTTGDVGVAIKTDNVQIQRANNEPLFLNRTSSDGTILSLRKDGAEVGSVGVTNGSQLYIGSNDTALWFSNGFNQIIPYDTTTGAGRDNAIDLGRSSIRFDDIYATNGTIQTSDRNEKQDIAELTDAETRVAVAAKGLLRKFRWIDSVEEKGDEARTHFGIIAQDLQDAFTAEGLDASDYAMFISSTWTNDDGEEQTRLGVRYSELLAFIIAAI